VVARARVPEPAGARVDEEPAAPAPAGPGQPRPRDAAGAVAPRQSPVQPVALARAWGAAALAGAAVFTVGWAVKGSNPSPSHQGGHADEPPRDAAGQEP
jgi:hypothetical protein